MRSGRRWMDCAMALAIVAGCGGDPETELLVDLRTDFLAGTELARVRTLIESSSPSGARFVEESIEPGDDLVDGHRVANLTGLPAGPIEARVELLGRDGRLLAQRPVIVELRGRVQITVVVTRDCGPVTCPGPTDDASFTACIGGTCMDPRCTVESSETCGSECTTDAECLPPAVGCGYGLCASGACLEVSTACGVDAGRRDGGDTDSDAGRGMDAGPPPPVDAGPTRTCPPTCTRCEGDVCVIVGGAGTPEIFCPARWSCRVECGSRDACAQNIHCQDGESCEVRCGGNASCAGNILCGAASSCTVVCSNELSCTGTIECGVAGPCNLTCSGRESCQGRVTCGSNRCNLGCGGSRACPTVDCASSCNCTLDCGLSACGVSVMCPPDCMWGDGCDDVFGSCDPTC